jgi:glyoxylate/hydroxypyruvate reductase A
MSILLHPSRDEAQWLAAFQGELPDMDIYLWPDVPSPDEVEFVIASRHDPADLHRFPNLQAVLAMGAGIEQYMSPEMPDVPVVRLADPSMSDEMAAYVVHWLVHFQKRMDAYLANQAETVWREEPYTAASDYPVGILGFGTIGRHIGRTVAGLGFPINAWSRTGTDAAWAASFAGLDELDAFLDASAAVVNVLPHTADTAGLLNASRFDHFRPGALLINLGRGATTNEADLLAALNDARVGNAVLDVTEPEPMAEDNPLWGHPSVRITPHAAGFTLIPSAAVLIAANIRRMVSGEEPYPIVDRSRGY